MKNSKCRKIFSIVLIFTMLFALVACSGSNSTSSASVDAQSSEVSASPTPSQSSDASASNSNYPNKPVTCVVAWSAGGTTDVAARLLGSMVNKYLGQPFVIDNQPGGAAVTGTAATADAPADGYTIGINWGASWTLRPYLLDVPYTVDDFEYIIGLWPSDYILMVNADSPFQTVDDLVKYAKEHPGELNYGASNTASYMHLTGEYFKKVAGIEAEMIPYEGSRPATVAMIGGFVDYNVSEPTSAQAEYEAGSIRYLCSFSDERLPEFPDLPTARELGYDVYLPHTQMIVGPAGMPEETVKALHDSIKATLEDEDFIKLAKNAGLRIQYKSGEEVRKEIEESIEITKPLIEEVMKE